MKIKYLSLKTIGSIMLMAAVVTFTSCGNRQAKESEDLQVSKEKAFEDVTTYPIPTAFEVIQLINKAGASYIISICNPADSVGKYISEKDKAVNLGIYGADLAYSTTYQMKQETMNYLKVSKQLIEELNINTGFNLELANKVEKNIDNKDSLISIITDSFYETYKNLIENGKESLSLMVITGSWIEGAYITSEIALTSRDNADFLKILASQKAPMSKLVELMKPRLENPEVKEMMDKLSPIVELYNSVESDTLTDAQFQKLIESITSVRNSLI